MKRKDVDDFDNEVEPQHNNKTARLDTPFSAYLQLQPPQKYLRQPPQVARPTRITCFSYDDDRTLLLPSSSKHNHALRWYRPPPVPANLRYAEERCIWREEAPEGLDSLLATIAELPPPQLHSLLSKTSLITWRGIMTKILTAAYEDRDSWSLDAMLFDGVLYLQEYMSEESIQSKRNTNPRLKSMMYQGYAFESYCTTSSPNYNTQAPYPSSSSSFSSSASSSWSADVNTNAQWCSICKTGIGQYRSILGGEVDCLFPPPQSPSSSSLSPEEIEKAEAVELKTNFALHSERDYVNFERYKLLKFYIQSFLLGISRVIVGFRSKQGQLVSTTEFQTLQIPRLVRDKPHGWDPNICLNAGHSVIDFIYTSLSKHDETIRHQKGVDDAISLLQPFPDKNNNDNHDHQNFPQKEQVDPHPSASDDNTTRVNGDNDDDETSPLKNWPVYRITFTPKASSSTIAANQTPSISIFPSTNYNLKSNATRVGFLPKTWIRQLWEHRLSQNNKEKEE